MKYRILRKGEKVREGDEFIPNRYWEKSNQWNTEGRNQCDSCLYRRPVKRGKGRGRG